MSSNSELQMIVGNDRFRGFGNLVRRENQKWWPMRPALSRIVLWVLLLNGILAMSLFVLPTLTSPEGGPLFEDNPLQMSSEMFAGVAAVALAIGAIVMMQDTIIEEVELGTAAWVLSKPASRTAFITAKFVASTTAVLFLMIVPVTLGAYGLFWMYQPGAFTWFQVGAMMAVITLHTLFYLTLALLLGTLTTRRGVLLAVTLGSLLGGGFIPLKALVQIAPWHLQQVALFILNGQALGRIEMTMLVATAVWCLFFLEAAIWRFERTEF